VNFVGVASLPTWQWEASPPAPTESVRVVTEDDEIEAGESEAGEQREHFWEEVHEVLAYTILVLAILHALAALKHHFVDRDDVLRSMLPGRKQASASRAGEDRTS